MNTTDIEKSEWFKELVCEINSELKLLNKQAFDKQPAMVAEKNKLEKQIEGWISSLSNPSLSISLRSAIENKFNKVTERIQEIDVILENLESEQNVHQHVVNSKQVLKCIENLSEVLNSGNASLLHMELSLHIDKIDCHPDKRVVMRTSRLGALIGAIPFLSKDISHISKSDNSSKNNGKVIPRRRAQLDTGFGSSQDNHDSLAHWAADPNRFEGLDERWFEEVEFKVPTEVHPFQIRAKEIAQARKEGKTHAQLAKQFNMTTPTIRKALKHAEKSDPLLAEMPRKMPAARWHEDHALEVLALKQKGLGTNDLVKHFGKSDTTIRCAINHANEQLVNDKCEQA